MRPLIISVVSAILLSCIVGFGWAQEKRGEVVMVTPAKVKQAEVRAPQLIAKDGDASKTLALAKADIHVAIAGYLAQTTMVLTFSNETPRVLEGELSFPLPENATVSGYGIDVNGEMVDGVPVDKLKARVTYEKEIRRRVDPGLVEQTEGNNFRTRVYPIPAHGSRTVKVQYVADLTDTPEGAAYGLPLNWGQAVGECSIKVEVDKAAAEPVVHGGAGELAFKHWENRYVAEQTLHNVNFNSDLLISLPQVPRQQAMVEKRVKETQSVDNLIEGKADKDLGRGEYFFVINDKPQVVTVSDVPAKKVQRVGILWDASLSRAEADKTREYAVIKSLVAKIDAGAVDVIAFRNVADMQVEFQIANGNADEVIHHLQSLVYDGGTNLGAVEAFGQTTALQNASVAPGAYDYWLLFTDGLADLGPEMPRRLEAPVYTISSDSRANPALLRRIAAESGGAYFNLQRVSNDQVAQSVGVAPFSLVGVEFKPGEISDVYPRGAVPALGRVSISGKLLVPEAKVMLKYGFGAAVTQQVEVTLKQDGAGQSGLVPRYWAQQKVADLSSDVEANGDELSAVGREFGLVTPNSSLLVLETVEQYLEHRIVPPKSRKAVYDQFMVQIEQQKTAHQQTHEEKIAQVLELWKGRLEWWNGEHKYAKDFKYSQPNGSDVVVAATSAHAGVEITALGGASTQQGASSGARLRMQEPALQPAENQHGLITDPSSAHDRPAGGPQPAAPPTSVHNRTAAQPGDVAEARRHEADPAAPEKDQQKADEHPVRQLAEQASAAANDPRPVASPNRPMATGHDGIYNVRDLATDVPDFDGAKKLNAEAADAGAAITIKEWDPNTPYLLAMKAAGADKAYGVYLEQRKSNAASPAFYLDCADYLLRVGQHAMGVRVLTNIVELKLESAPLLRVAAGRLAQTGLAGDRDLAIELYEKVLKMRPEEPQSSRDLALALADRADALLALSPTGADLPRAMADYQRSLELLNKVIMGQWDTRFAEIELPALMEANRLIARLDRLPRDREIPIPLDSRLVKLVDLDVRIVLQWDADATDVDLWVTEPTGEKCVYDHNRTTIGGLLSRDFTQGYGPEEYCLRKAMPGAYKVQANYYGSSQVSLVGPATVQATVITNFGRADEKRQCLTIRLTNQKDVVDLGTITLGANADVKPAGK